ncbi:hypothetical protein ACFU5N_05265 [Streptomyces albidoflavus]
MTRDHGPGTGVPTGARPSCATCAGLLADEVRARAEYDWSKATDCRVLLRRHHLADHQGQS